MNKKLQRSQRSQPCDLCDGTSFEVVGRKDRKNRTLTTVICETCGLVSHEHVPTDEELLNYYEFEYRKDYHGEYVPSPHRVLRAWESGQNLVNRLNPFIEPNGKVFEVGAGIGCTLKSFEKAGFTALGIEPGEGFQKYGSEQIKANVRRITLDKVNLQEPVDLVILAHVIEHLNSPRTSIAQIRRLLKPGGMFYVECPNVGAPHAAPGKLFHYAHIYNFTRDTLNMLMNVSGFKLHKAFSGPTDRTHSLLYEAAARRDLEIIPDSYQNALAGIFRYNLLTYHLRPNYLADRLKRDLRFVSNHCLARLRVRNIFSGKRDSQNQNSLPRNAA